MKKNLILLIVAAMLVSSLCACTKKKNNSTKNDEIVTDEKIQSHIPVPTENKPNEPIKKEVTPYMIKNFDTNEILGYLDEDSELVKKVTKDVTEFVTIDNSMKPDNVEKLVNRLLDEHRVNSEILDKTSGKELIDKVISENSQDDFYSLDIKEMRFNDDKNIVTVVGTYKFLNTKMDLKIRDFEACYEYYPNYDVWAYSGNYTLKEVQ